VLVTQVATGECVQEMGLDSGEVGGAVEDSPQLMAGTDRVQQRLNLPSGDELRQRPAVVVSIRYLDTFAKQDGAWLFAERRLMVDWTDTRPSRRDLKVMKRR
jgi:hypothetical protein